jgi:hypothetical protein
VKLIEFLIDCEILSCPQEIDAQPMDNHTIGRKEKFF